MAGSRSGATRMTVSHQTFARKKPDQLVYLELGSGNGGMLLSISEDGFRFRAVSPLRANTLVPFAFSLDGAHRLQGIGEVEWLEDDGKSGGMRFSELSDESRTLLHTWLALGDQRQRSSGREATPAAATPLDTMEKIREELRRGYPARPSSEAHTTPDDQSKLEKNIRPPRTTSRANRVVPEKSPTAETPSFAEAPARQEKHIGPQEPVFRTTLEPELDPSIPPPPTAVPILERLMGPRRIAPSAPEREQLAEPNSESSPSVPASSEPPAIAPGPPPFTKPADPPAAARPPFSISAFLKGSKETSRPQGDVAPASAAVPPAKSAEPLPTLRSFTLTDSGDVSSPAGASVPMTSASSNLRHLEAKDARGTFRLAAQPRIPSLTPPSTAPASRPYIPPPDTSFEAAWLQAKLTAPPETPHLSRAAASAIIGLALAVILGALAYNFRQDIGAIIIDVGQKVSGEAHSARADSSTETAQTGNPDATQPSSAQPSEAAGADAKPADATTQPAASTTTPVTTSQPSGGNKPAPSSSNLNSSKTSGNPASSPASKPPLAPSNSSGINKDGDATASQQRPNPQAGPTATDSNEQSPEASSPAGSGQEEFNAARDILKGTNRERDLQTAVALLWSGVRKGYVPAEVTLADLYRRGEGVEKNCDQAQVLLVAASRKGSPDARRLLESMAEQGCQ